MLEYTTYLSGDSFRETAKKIREYRENLMSLVETFCLELAKEGETVIRSIIVKHNKGTGETLGSVEIVSESGDGFYTARIRVTSDAIMFLEFGSGLLGATNVHPTGLYGAGTFGQAPRQNPEYENWENPEGWFYKGNDGQYHKSFGMEADMPMYRGAAEMKVRLVDVAMRVFGHA